MSPGPRLATVVIGRNEGERLSTVLRAACDGTAAPVVYVDSRSSDGSVDRAKAEGVMVREVGSGPCTAALGRQIGLDALLDAYPGLEYVQFLDGDCLLEAGWTGRAVAFLDAHPRAGCVTGRRREEHAATSVYAAMVDVDWDVPAGLVPHPGGDSVCRVLALKQVGGWAVELIAGEDPDLGFRMVDAGWEVHRLADSMTMHDIRIKSFGGFWRRSVRSGHAYAEVGLKHRRGAGRGWFRHLRGLLLYGAAFPVVGVVMAVWWWPGLVVIAALYVRMLWSMVRYCRARGRSRVLAWRYAVCNGATKFGEALGALRYLIGRAAGRRSTIIEYRGDTSSGAVRKERLA